MSFNSLAFLIFFPTVCLAYFILPQRFRWFLLLAASCYFYMAFIPAYMLILAAVICVDYTVGILLERTQGKARTKLLLASICANIGLLFVFKYYNFFNANVAELAHVLHWNYALPALTWALPIGLSFHTFQSLSYIIEVYRGNQKAERHFGIYALYVMFFPQLVAGPIERPQNMLHQFHETHVADAARIAAGLRLMAWGFFQKLVIADTAAVYVNQVFGDLHAYQGLGLAFAILLFAFQVYGDFSGYSDIARGSAQVLGFRLMENFDRPYAASSMSDFWQRWHISLSSWLKDYVYFPLVRAVSRPGIRWICISLFLTLLMSGLWHGAGWTYVAWGALHGSYLVIGALTRSLRKRLVEMFRLARHPIIHASLQHAYVFALTFVSWIFFRSASIGDAWYIITHLQHGFSRANLAHTSLDPYQWASLALAIGLLLFREWLYPLWQRLGAFASAHAPLRFALDYGLMLWIILFAYFSQSAFIYFQF